MRDGDGEAEAETAFDEKVGVIRGCTWRVIEEVGDKDQDEEDGERDGRGRAFGGGGAGEVGSGIVITLTYDTVVYRVILYGPSPSHSQASGSASAVSRYQHQTPTLPLLLTRTPIPLTKRLLTFLLDTFDIRISALKLPQSLLYSTLESYIQILYRNSTTMSSARRSGFLKSVLNDIKISLSFSAPITPHLRTLDFDIPPETVCNLIEESVASKSSFMQALAVHLEHHTGMQLPAPADKDSESESGGVEQLIRISKFICHAFALSGDGRFKIVEKARSAAEVENLGHVVREANEMVLAALLEEAGKT